ALPILTEIQPNVVAYGNKLDQKAIAHPLIGELKEKGFDITIRGMKKAIEIFREVNIPLMTEAQSEERKYGAIAGAMTVTLDGEEMTLQKAGDRLQAPNPKLRETAQRTSSDRRTQDREQ